MFAWLKAATVHAVVRNDRKQVTRGTSAYDRSEELKSHGAQLEILDIGSCSSADVAELLKKTKADAVVWAAAAGEGDAAALRAVDYGGVVKVCEACEATGVRRLVVVSTMDARPPNQIPKYYDAKSTEGSKGFLGRTA